MLRITIAMCLLVLLLQAAFDAGQLAKNRGQKTPKANKGFPAKVPAMNLGRVSADLRQWNRPLPPPSNGWIVIMQRFDFSLDFNRNWFEYKHGFGELGLQKEFWLGNELIHLLTTGAPHKLRIEKLIDGTLLYADYDSFSIDSEDKIYALHISGYSGNAPDSPTMDVGLYHDGANFSTRDAQVGYCANLFKAGWWFKDCLTSKLYNGSPLWGSLWSSLNYTSARMRMKRK